MTNLIGRLRGRRGVALPLALTGLVVVSLLVTTALLTGTTESAISAAQSSGTRSLYDAEGAVQNYLSTLITSGQGLSLGITNVVLDENDRTVRITRALLQNEQTAADTRTITASLLAEPLNDDGQTMGRAVVAMVRQEGLYATMTLNVNEGAVVGTDLTVGGNSKVIDRSTECAVLHADGAVVRESGSGDIQGAVRESQYSGQAFVNQVLNGRSLTQFAQLADIKFGPMFNKPAFPSSAHPKFDNDSTNLRWGCPTGMGIDCSSNPAATTFYPVIAIDAGGGVVDLQGDHGQGILIVVNGSLQITGNFKFKGILLIDGYIDMSGTGGQTGSKIEGSVVAFGNNTDRLSRVDESETQGNAVISYNRCQVNAAQEAYNRRARENPIYAPPTTTFAWYEVVR
jgi:Tfp pilus assembly protein PilX